VSGSDKQALHFADLFIEWLDAQTSSILPVHPGHQKVPLRSESTRKICIAVYERYEGRRVGLHLEGCGIDIVSDQLLASLIRLPMVENGNDLDVGAHLDWLLWIGWNSFANRVAKTCQEHVGMRKILLVSILVFLFAPVLANDGPTGNAAVLHMVRPGDTLGKLSRLYGSSPEALRQANDWKRVEESKSFWIPATASWPKHNVRDGDTLLAISEGYGIPLQQLRDANGLLTDPLPVGHGLILPRAKKPEWRVKGLQASRSGKAVRRPVSIAPVAKPEPRVVEAPPAPVKPSGKWVKVKTNDGRDGWVRTDALSYRPAPDHPEPKTSAVPALSFGQKLDDGQKRAILAVVDELAQEGFQVQADDVATFMALETGGTFSPSTRAGGRPHGAVGLAQFTDIAIRDMNTRRPANDQLTKTRLANMSFQEQSLVVAEYLGNVLKRRKMTGKQVTGHDLYAAIFAPRAVGKAESFVVYGRNRDGGAYYRNQSLDQNRDGRITKAEMAQRFTVWSRKGQKQRG
jgi:LysM repeat protein